MDPSKDMKMVKVKKEEVTPAEDGADPGHSLKENKRFKLRKRKSLHQEICLR